MMNLIELKQLKFKAESLPVYCHQQAEKALDSALQLMEAAQASPQPGCGKLLQAVPLLMDAIRYHRQDIRPRIALAYVFSILEEEDMALACLAEALSLDAQNPLVRALERALERNGLSTSFEPLQTRVVAPADVYDRIDKQILSRTMRLMKYPHYQLEAAASAERARALLTALLEVRAICQELWLRLDQLEGAIDIRALRQRMQPLEAQLRRLEQKYLLCGEYRLLQKEMELTLNACCHLEGDFSRQLAAGTLGFEIEILLNDCEGFADRLDALTNCENQAPELLLLYQCMMEQVADLQDRQQMLKGRGRAIA